MRSAAPVAGSIRSSSGACAWRCATSSLPATACVRAGICSSRRCATRSSSTSFDTREARRAAALARTIAVLRDELERGAGAHELLWTAWERLGLERAWGEIARGHGPLAERADRDLDAVVALFQAAKRFEERSVDANPARVRAGTA